MSSPLSTGSVRLRRTAPAATTRRPFGARTTGFLSVRGDGRGDQDRRRGDAWLSRAPTVGSRRRARRPDATRVDGRGDQDHRRGDAALTPKGSWVVATGGAKIAAGGRAQPVESDPPHPPFRPAGATETTMPGTSSQILLHGVFSTKSSAPSGAGWRVHPLSTGSVRLRRTAPVATARRPSGAMRTGFLSTGSVRRRGRRPVRSAG